MRDEQAVLVRVIPGVRPETHAAVATGQEDSKFGLAPADARRAIERLRGSDRLRLDGLHVHIGSQILDAAPFGQAVQALAAYGEFAVYDLGGGLGARYTYDDRPPERRRSTSTCSSARRASTCRPARGSSSSPGAAWSRAPA